MDYTHPTKRTLAIVNDGKEARCTLAEFCEANASDEESCEIAAGLMVGESASLGGGAAPQFTITRTE